MTNQRIPWNVTRTVSAFAALALVAAMPSEPVEGQERMAVNQTHFVTAYDQEFVRGFDLMAEREREVEPGPMVGRLIGNGTIVYRGKKPVETRIFAWFMSGDGQVLGRVASEPFDMEPGRTPVDGHLDGRSVQETVETAFHLDAYLPAGGWSSPEGDRVEGIPPEIHVSGRGAVSDIERWFDGGDLDRRLDRPDVVVVVAAAPTESALERTDEQAWGRDGPAVQPAAFAFSVYGDPYDEAR